MAALGAAFAGRWDEARVEYERVIAGFRELDFEFEAAMTALAFGAALGARFPEARKAGEDAEAWFGERGGSSAVEPIPGGVPRNPSPSICNAGRGAASRG